MTVDEAIKYLRNPLSWAIGKTLEKQIADNKEATQMAIDALEKQRWIPCSERQPDVNGWYITTISGEICGQDRALSGISEFANGKWVSGDDVDETEMTFAWMPLPEPYQEEEEW